ncbi:MAG: hypothetical protein M3336_04460, partial [Chloroflexota bacterium]|nr:hypothetical protein [Chloroflexota bacterium]
MVTGTLELTVTTTGRSVDPDGYLVRLDDGDAQAVAANSVVTIDHLAVGPHSLAVTGAAFNCTLAAGLLSVE